jgi:endonuclease/exonuclease/phosphatase family metal-dependent hydrolase
VPTKEKTTKESSCYDKLDSVYQKTRTRDIKIMMGDMNAEVGKDTRAQNVHDVSHDNGTRLKDFAVSRNMVVRFPHKDIHKETWISPGSHTKNQIDHVLIDC